MPRCIHCSEKFEKKFPYQQGRFRFCLNNLECINEFNKIRKEYQEKERKKTQRKETKVAKEKLKTKKDYEKELETIFNKFIRLRDENQPCISCGASPNTFTKSAGHYFPAGSEKSVRFDEDNVHLQCWYNCNKNKHGNLSAYLPNLIQKIGQERFHELVIRKNSHRHYSIPELIELKVIYKDKIKELGE